MTLIAPPIEQSRRTRRAGAFAIGVVLVLGLALGGCGKRGPLENPQVTTGVDEQGNKIREPAPEPDYSKPFVLDPILF
ncbi:MAG: hypothetical protein AAGL24_15630 [Pseudomonadota bacterium]